ncbi:MAG: sn-glycerol-3-phosphate ABC transporter ATP-binding protein UgpC [bacterium]|nr:sn-glycerol-3-phosphate ABC transporter ATP-binding protein UgpC [bacterium]
MAKVTLTHIEKIYHGGFQAVKDVNLEIADKEFCVLVGPSGCGKSTTLRMIAGLEDISHGEIHIGDRLVNDVPAKDRDIAMVFQNYALYPHMTVYDNMAFGLKLRKFPKKEIDYRVREASEILGITTMLERKPKALSGGQRQRVAVGRAIVRKPSVFLFDEPLSNLDAKLRGTMRAEIKKLHENLQTTMIYVTHDQVEAMTMGDKIVVMKDGVIQQVSDPLNLYDNPTSKFVAGFIGSPPMNFLNCCIIEKNDMLYLKDIAFELRVPKNFEDKLTSYLNKNVVLGMRPEDIYDKLYATSSNIDNTAGVTVDVVEPMGSHTHLLLNIGEQKIIATVESQNRAKSGQDIDIVFNLQKMQIFDEDTKHSILGSITD